MGCIRQPYPVRPRSWEKKLLLTVTKLKGLLGGCKVCLKKVIFRCFTLGLPIGHKLKTNLCTILKYDFRGFYFIKEYLLRGIRSVIFDGYFTQTLNVITYFFNIIDYNFVTVTVHAFVLNTSSKQYKTQRCRSSKLFCE